MSAVGIGAAQTAASVRAGVSGFRESELLSERFDPYTLAALPDACLEPLAPGLRDDPQLRPRTARLLRLASPALREAAGTSSGGAAVPVFLGLPEDCADGGRDLLAYLALQSNLALDLGASRVFPHGRAAGLLALQAALAHVASRGGGALAGGVDCYRDQHLLDALDREGRVLVPGALDGFVPGEGAAFVLLRRRSEEAGGADGLGTLSAVAVGEEPGHRYSDQPCCGDGLTRAFAGLLDGLGNDAEPARTVMAGLNGESFWAKEWGAATLRTQRLIADDARVEHPADCFGDAGAALGPLLLVVAVAGLGRGWLRAPVLVWCASDRAERAAAYLQATRRAGTMSAEIGRER
jgi:3-oxoacyl-[acyl-carrier-protein] synthase-1